MAQRARTVIPSDRQRDADTVRSDMMKIVRENVYDPTKRYEGNPLSHVGEEFKSLKKDVLIKVQENDGWNLQNDLLGRRMMQFDMERWQRQSLFKRSSEVRVIDAPNFTLTFSKMKNMFQGRVDFMTLIEPITVFSAESFGKVIEKLQERAKALRKEESSESLGQLEELLKKKDMIEGAELRRVWEITNYTPQTDYKDVYEFKSSKEKIIVSMGTDGLLKFLSMGTNHKTLEIAAYALMDNPELTRKERYELFDELKDLKYPAKANVVQFQSPILQSIRFLGMFVHVAFGKTMCSMGHTLYCTSVGFNEATESGDPKPQKTITTIQDADPDSFINMFQILFFKDMADRVKGCLFLVQCCKCDGKKSKRAIKKTSWKQIAGEIFAQKCDALLVNAFNGVMCRVNEFEIETSSTGMIKEIISECGF